MEVDNTKHHQAKVFALAALGIEHSPLEWTDHAHIRQGSALVHVGDTVKAGQPIARVGKTGSGDSEWISLPWRLRGFRVVEAGGAPCNFEVKSARVQEGWMMEFPKHE